MPLCEGNPPGNHHKGPVLQRVPYHDVIMDILLIIEILFCRRSIPDKLLQILHS